MIQLKPLTSPIKAKIEIPGCLSYTTRSLILASLTRDLVTIKKPLFSDDVHSMISCLSEVGVDIEIINDNILVKNSIQELDFSSGINSQKKFEFKGQKITTNFICNGGLSGRTVRSILPLLCLVPGEKILTADSGFLKRPIGDQVDGLKQMGAEIEYLNEEGKLPLLIKSSKLKPGKIAMKGNISSQYFAGIMMIAPLVGEVEIEVIGEQASKSYIDITTDIMKTFGVNVENNNYQSYLVKAGSQYNLKEYKVEGDYSSASYIAAIAVLNNSEIELTNLNPNSVQGDKMVLDIIQKMGAEVEFKKDSVIVAGRELKDLKSVDVDMESTIDQPPTISVLASFINGITTISGIEILKYKESDRLLAIRNELEKMDIKTEGDGKELKIFGGDPKPCEIDTYGDHRIAMAFGIAGSKIDGVKIKNPEVVKKSFPGFWEVINSLGVESVEI
jgi:3-phosphoshikimate 1-carboxyvinyltransferase